MTTATLTGSLTNFAGVVAGHALGAGMDMWRHAFPHTVRVETTNHCQASCSFCPRSTIGRDKTFMTNELYEKIVRECVAGKVRIMHLHNFGEPLLDKQLPDRIAYARKAGIPRVKIFTNGALLKGKMAERLLEAGLDEIKISIDGADGSEFNILRVGLNHDEVLENTREFRRLRDASGNAKPTIVAATCQTSNREATEKMLAGVVDHIDFTRIHNWAGSLGELTNQRVRKPCDRLWRSFTILVNGDVALCCRDHSGKEILGNVADHSIREIWNNKRYNELRKIHKESRQEEIPLCKDCTSCFY